MLLRHFGVFHARTAITVHSSGRFMIHLITLLSSINLLETKIPMLLDPLLTLYKRVSVNISQLKIRDSFNVPELQHYAYLF